MSDQAIAVDLRFFAAAADAAGRTEERLEVPAGTTVAGLRSLLARRGADLAQVVDVSSYLVNAVAVGPEAPVVLDDGDRIDVLPPFAGG